jgi:predicted nuclease of predicted toxin-antitoxin system
MKLLFDENLSPKLPEILSSQFPGSLHVRDCGLKGFSDEAIWGYARNHDFTVISKDSDFVSYTGIPPN